MQVGTSSVESIYGGNKEDVTGNRRDNGQNNNKEGEDSGSEDESNRADATTTGLPEEISKTLPGNSSESSCRECIREYRRRNGDQKYHEDPTSTCLRTRRKKKQVR